MRNFKITSSKLFRGIGVLTLAMGLTLFVGCQNQEQKAGEDKNTTQEQATKEQTTSTFDPDEVVVVIENEEIKRSFFNLYFWIAQQQFETAGPNIWDIENGGGIRMVDLARDNALENIGMAMAAKQKAQELGLALSEEDQTMIQEQTDLIMTSNEDLINKLKFKKEDMQTFISYDLFLQKVIQNLSDVYTPTEEELNEQIEKNKVSYETATVKHVLIKTQDEAGNPLSEDKIAEAKKLAEDILQKALKGEDMAQLAKTYSEDPGSKDQGGEYTFPRGRMVIEFERASFLGEIGKVYPELVETAYGYHIIKVESRNEGDAEVMRQDSESMLKNQYAQDKLLEISKTLTIDKKDVYSTIDVFR